MKVSRKAKPCQEASQKVNTTQESHREPDLTINLVSTTLNNAF